MTAHRLHDRFAVIAGMRRHTLAALAVLRDDIKPGEQRPLFVGDIHGLVIAEVVKVNILSLDGCERRHTHC
jgi:hypothetical protein